ncbi:hypothetical protein BC937DRAFT_95491 [Endogone sp. FLAS-F59071]|nr:hypothetical protein BC937DRAFT_95491 [Endogone sp. FLAS-F59071]|eukprot:RUS13327.1 hypothetical protein BC937DRAFT_95491 [Endogone sp. FLAS-F59071]
MVVTSTSSMSTSTSCSCVRFYVAHTLRSSAVCTGTSAPTFCSQAPRILCFVYGLGRRSTVPPSCKSHIGSSERRPRRVWPRVKPRTTVSGIRLTNSTACDH